MEKRGGKEKGKKKFLNSFKTVLKPLGRRKIAIGEKNEKWRKEGGREKGKKLHSIQLIGPKIFCRGPSPPLQPPVLTA